MQNPFPQRWLPWTLCVVVSLIGMTSVISADESDEGHSGDGHSGMVSFKLEVPAEEAETAEKKLKTTYGKVHVHRHHEGPPLGFRNDLPLWSLATFILFVWVLKRFAWGPIASGLDKRESNIRQDIADAEAARKGAEKMLADRALKLERVQASMSPLSSMDRCPIPSLECR